MRLRTLLLGIVALVFGASSALGVYLLGRPTSVSARTETTPIVVLTQSVQRGTSLTADDVRLQEWPLNLVPEGALTSLDEAIGRTTWLPFAAGEPVLEEKLAAEGAGSGLAALIPPGFRAVTIQTPNVSTGVAGFVLPGNKVDVLLTLGQGGIDDSSGGGGTMTLLQNVEILAVDQRIEAPSENVVDPKELRSVTLLVTPADATRLDLGQNKGTLSLALRNPVDTETNVNSRATLAQLRSGHATHRVVPEPVGEPSPEKQQTDEVAPQNEVAGVSMQPEPVAAPTPSPAPQPREVRVSRIRTLRGISSGSVYLRSGIPLERDPGTEQVSHHVQDGSTN